MDKKRKIFIAVSLAVFVVIPVISVIGLWLCDELLDELVYSVFGEHAFLDRIFGTVMLAYIFGILPVGLSIWNIVNCFINKVTSERLSSIFSSVYGFILYVMYFAVWFEIEGDWYVQIHKGQYHKPISSEYLPCIVIIFLVGAAGFVVLLFSNAKKLPPLISAFAIGAVILLNVFQILYAVQLSKNALLISSRFDIYLYVYHFNILLISAIAIKRHLIEQLKAFKEEGAGEGRGEFFKKLYRFMSSLAGYSAVVFVALFIIIAVLEILFIMMGKGPIGPIKAFTDTADWTFSKQIPPPPLEYEGHYLCTVAAGGHKKIVKPLRLGTRRNATIIVNRQLCVANAFEEKIQEISPGFHRIVRGAYDKYGFPLSSIITTPLKADIVYILMKPLEWIFLIFLYLTDSNPENRIGRQYSYRQ